MPDIISPSTVMPTVSQIPSFTMPGVDVPASVPADLTPEAEAAVLEETVRQVTPVEDRTPVPPLPVVPPVPTLQNLTTTPYTASPPPVVTRPPVVAPPPYIPPVVAPPQVFARSDVETSTGRGMITFTPGRALTPEETTSSSMQSSGFGILGVILMIIALSIFGGMVNGGGIFAFILLAGVVALGVLALRKAITATAVSFCTLAASASVPLNGELVVDIRLGLLKNVPITGVKLQLQSLAEHTDRNAKNQKSTEVLYGTKVMLEPGTVWVAGKVMSGRAMIHIPNEGIPGFKVNSNEVRWELVLDIEIPGWYPDIQKKIPVQVIPSHPGVSNPPASPVTFQLPNLGDMNAKVMIMASRGTSDIPALALGKAVKMVVTVNPTSQPKANSKL
ncbi:MAG: hypothetical protein WCJ56_06425, partial [bacterium]